jgi:hypothetical protein
MWLEWPGWLGVGAICAIAALAAVAIAGFQYLGFRSTQPNHGIHASINRAGVVTNGFKRVETTIEIMGSKTLYEPQIRSYGLGDLDRVGEGRRFADVHSEPFKLALRVPADIPRGARVALVWIETRGTRTVRMGERFAIDEHADYEQWRQFRFARLHHSRHGKWVPVKEARPNPTAVPLK